MIIGSQVGYQIFLEISIPGGYQLITGYFLKNQLPDGRLLITDLITGSNQVKGSNSEAGNKPLLHLLLHASFVLLLPANSSSLLRTYQLLCDFYDHVGFLHSCFLDVGCCFFWRCCSSGIVKSLRVSQCFLGFLCIFPPSSFLAVLGFRLWYVVFIF